MEQTSPLKQETVEKKKWSYALVESNSFLTLPKNPSSYPKSKVRAAPGDISSCCGVISAVFSG
jgi:hypothetical protein